MLFWLTYILRRMGCLGVLGSGNMGLYQILKYRRMCAFLSVFLFSYFRFTLFSPVQRMAQPFVLTDSRLIGTIVLEFLQYIYHKINSRGFVKPRLKHPYPSFPAASKSLSLTALLSPSPQRYRGDWDEYRLSFLGSQTYSDQIRTTRNTDPTHNIPQTVA